MGRYPPVQRVTPRLVRFFGFGPWGPIPSGWGDVFLAASNLSASRPKRCAVFSIGRRISGLLIAFARSPS
jgi:hypothetical protein